MSDIDTVGVDGLKVLDPKRPIREAMFGSLPWNGSALSAATNSLRHN